MNELNDYFRNEQYFFASTSSSPYETISMLNTVTEPDDEYLIYDEENISTSTSSHVISDSTSSQVPPYEITTNIQLDDESDESDDSSDSLKLDKRVLVNSSNNITENIANTNGRKCSKCKRHGHYAKTCQYID
ncbi:10697_t:CDS:2 [Cetraspora pellucida]|uniref:10697_t:CDS:1 n=1 Tax=Cetraspora pellucida TaxID=1433469 RepID=A0ACA9L6Q9_9GLOM|nr:10697_t:CDS:2 [Cetraspora pellucida]